MLPIPTSVLGKLVQYISRVIFTTLEKALVEKNILLTAGGERERVQVIMHTKRETLMIMSPAKGVLSIGIFIL